MAATNAILSAEELNPLSLSSSQEFRVPEFRRSASLKEGDRFIPCRNAMDTELSHFSLTNENMASNLRDEIPEQQYKSVLSHSLYNGELDHAKVLAFKNKAPVPAYESGNSLARAVLYSENKIGNKQRSSTRAIPSQAERVLDAPSLMDDYYLNLLDWSVNNILAVALNDSVFLWHGSSGEITKLMDVPEGDIVTSVSWVGSSSPHIAVGTSNPNSCVQLWDVQRGKRLRSFADHGDRVGALSWNKHILSSGSADQSIINRDVRQKNATLSRWNAHSQEIIGLKWSPDGTRLASGGNDNLLNIWNADDLSVSSANPTFQLTEHTAAVKALDWCPWQSDLLASGGGTSDRTLRFWNTKTGACVNSIDTGSQVCSIKWSTHYKELVTSHGYSKNQLAVWKYPSLVKTNELTGHTSRVLHMAMSPDGQTVASAAGDETIRFWKVFEYNAAAKKKAAALKKEMATGSKNAALHSRRNLR